MNCTLCDRKAFADAEVKGFGSTWLYVCKSHFISEGCTFKEGRAEVLMTEPVYEADELLQDYESFIREIELCQPA